MQELGGIISIIQSVLGPFAIFGVIMFIKKITEIIKLQYKMRFYKAIMEESEI